MLPSFICEELGEETEDSEENEIDEGLLADILEKAPEIQWLYDVLHLPEEEVLLMLRENPGLLAQTCKFYCIRNKHGTKDGCFYTNQMDPRVICRCCLEAELLKPRLSKKKLLQQIIVNTFVGVCPHVLALLTSDSTILDNDFLCSKLTWAQSFLNIQHLSLLKADVGQHVDDYKNCKQTNKFHPRYISICGGNPLWYALLLDQHTVVKFFMKEYSLVVNYFQPPLCTQTPLLLAIVEKRSIKVLKMLTEEMRSEQAYDLFANEWHHVYWIHLYPSIFQGKDLSLLDEICKLIKKFVHSSVLKDFLRISLCYCLSNGMKENADYLIEKGATLVRQDLPCGPQDNVTKSFKTAEKVVEMNNPEILELYLKCSPENVDLCILFEKAVLLGTVDQVETILKKKESTLRPLTQQCEIRPATLALLRGSLSMLTFLLKNGIVEPLESPTAIDESSSPNQFVTRNSLYTWACLLELTDCANLIKSYGFNAEFNIRINPLYEFIIEFHRGFNIKDIKDRQRLSAPDSLICVVETLIKNHPEYISMPGPEGVQPFRTTVLIQGAFGVDESKHLKIAKLLLLNGANPFADPISLNFSLTNELLRILFYCNVNFSSKLDTILDKRWAEKRVLFIIRVVCCVSSEDKLYLVKKYIRRGVHLGDDLETRRRSLVEKYLGKKPNSTIGKLSSVVEYAVIEFLCTPRSLMRCCRDTLRERFKGNKIFTFTKMFNLPQKIKRYLLIQDEIEESTFPTVTLPEEDQFHLDIRKYY